MDKYIAIYCDNADEFNKIQELFFNKGYVWINSVEIDYRANYNMLNNTILLIDYEKKNGSNRFR